MLYLYIQLHLQRGNKAALVTGPYHHVSTLKQKLISSFSLVSVPVAEIKDKMP